MNDVLAKVELVLDQVIDESAEKYNVSTCADRNPDVGQCARARKARIDMDYSGATLLRFHHPAKTDRMRFGHGRAFDQNAIRVREILLRGRSSAPAEGGAQTGHRAAMSYPGLVGYTHHAQASGKEFFNEIIFFVIERSAAEVTDRSRMIDSRAILLVNERALARFPDAVGNHVHGAFQWNLRPLFRARGAVFHFHFAPRMRQQLVGGGAFRTKVPLTDRRLRVAFDRNQFPILVKNQLAAADATIGTNRARYLSTIDARMHCARLLRHRLETCPVFPFANLANQRPF